MEPILDLLLILALLLGVTLTNLLRTLFAQRIPAEVRIRAVSAARPPEPLVELFEATDRELTDLGFRHCSWCIGERTPAPPAGPMLLRLYCHRSEPVFARVHGPEDLVPADRLIVTFFSRRPDGELAGTINRIPEVFPRLPETLFEGQVTNVDTLAEQWRAHLSFIAGLGGPCSVPDDAETTCAILNDYERIYLGWLQAQGHTRPHPEGGTRVSARVALSFLLRSLTGKVTPSPPETAPIPARRAALLFRYWRENARRTAPMGVQWTLFAISGLLFAAMGALFWNLWVALMLLAVILFHEGGHYLAMRLFGYRNLQVLMLPLVGGVAMGFEARPAAANRAFVSLMGPLPGVVVGWPLLLLNLGFGGPLWLTQFAAILLALNYFNLLPITPLDGGQLLGALIPPQRVLLRLLLEGLAVVGLAWLAWSLQSGILGALALVPLMGLLGGRRERRMRDDLLAAWAAHPSAAESERTQAAIEVYDRHSKVYRPLLRKAREIDALIQSTLVKPASPLTTGLLLALYLATFAVPFVALPALGPTLALWFHGSASWSGPPMVDEAPFRDEARALEWSTLIQRSAELEGAGFRALTHEAPPVVQRPGATAGAITEAATRLGLSLPPGYQGFLLTSDGLRSTWDAEQAWLLPVHSIGYARDLVAPLLERLRQTAQELPELREGLFVREMADPDGAGRLALERLDALLVIGGLALDDGFIALDPTAPDAAGEFPVLYLGGDFDVTRYPNFRAFMEAEYVRLRVQQAATKK